MARMTPSSLAAMIQAQHADALAAISASKLSGARSDAMDYYNGQMSKDMPAPEGRSQAVSSDVADTIEGMMPNLMEVFFGGDETVIFEPVGPEDVKAAEQETDYVNKVFNQDNPGFMILYTFIKDALLSKVGVVKIFWEERKVEERETYTGLSEDEWVILQSDPDVEICEHTEYLEGQHPDDEERQEATSGSEVSDENKRQSGAY
jgi:hypothetical protein